MPTTALWPPSCIDRDQQLLRRAPHMESFRAAALNGAVRRWLLSGSVWGAAVSLCSHQRPVVCWWMTAADLLTGWLITCDDRQL